MNWSKKLPMVKKVRRMIRRRLRHRAGKSRRSSLNTPPALGQTEEAAGPSASGATPASEGGGGKAPVDGPSVALDFGEDEEPPFQPSTSSSPQGASPIGPPVSEPVASSGNPPGASGSGGAAPLPGAPPVPKSQDETEPEEGEAPGEDDLMSVFTDDLEPDSDTHLLAKTLAAVDIRELMQECGDVAERLRRHREGAARRP